MDDLCAIEIEGVDGSLWTIHGPGAGAEGVYLGTSPTGLFDAPVRTLWDQTAFGVGAEFRDVRFEPRDIVFSALVGDVAGRSWHSVDSDWRRAWDYRRDTKIHITSESGTRTLLARLFESPETVSEYDPRVNEFAVVTMTIRAGNPFYSSLPEHNSVQASGVSGSKSLVVSNPTNLPMFLEWALEPGARWTLPDHDFAGGNRSITMPSAFSSRSVHVDTDPLEEQIYVPGLPNAWALMNGVLFLHEVPPYTPETSLTVSWSGASGSPSATVRMKRQWSRPWGLE